jgi:hypothetical protein
MVVDRYRGIPGKEAGDIITGKKVGSDPISPPEGSIVDPLSEAEPEVMG